MKHDIDLFLKAIKILCPNGVGFNGVDIIPVSDSVPTQSEIDTQVAILKAEYDAQEYARKREAEYPSIQECVHAILDDQLDALQAKRASIKTKYPKG